MLRHLSTQILVLKRRNYGESDRLVTVLSKDFGKLTLIAKGVRKTTSKKRSYIEPFSHSKAQIVDTNKGFPVLTEVQPIQNLDAVRKSLKKVAVAFFFLESADKITQAGEKNQEIFDLVISFLKKLATANNLRDLRNEFTRQLITISGFAPKSEKITDPDLVLQEILERKLFSIKVGKRILI